MVQITRRRFLRSAAATGSVAALGGLGSIERAFAQNLPLPSPDASGIEHIVVVMMENRSYDHFLGWYDGADGRQGDCGMPMRLGRSIEPTALRRIIRDAVI